MAAARLPLVLRLFKVTSRVDILALLIGGSGAAVGERWGAYLLVAYVIAHVGSNLSVGTWAYREVMSRSWPEVPVLGDDEWDEW